MGDAMDPIRWKRVQQIFGDAMDLSPAERTVFLGSACEGDPELEAEVRSLLEQDDRDSLFVDRPAAEVLGTTPLGEAPADASYLDDDATTESIGPYRILETLGTGGMGRVYLAERTGSGFEQRVALKVIKRGFDTDEIVRRFESERRILARLQHPNIARLLDGGTTDGGLPYFTMEYVAGTPLDAHCKQRQLGVDQRLRLFETVCEAVQYAHGNLVVHRDLKPSNILVDGNQQVKLLDFGIAKVLEASGDVTLLTRTGARVMTPGYAAPEQVRGENVNITTDVYSLGAILYELLTGRRPYATGTRTPRQLEEAILSEVPERPSLAVRRTPRTGTTATESRPTNSGLPRRLSGDLDNICLKALRKEPERRYRSVEQLLEDLRRHRLGLPVLARPDTLGYRVSKFVGRNRVAVLGTTLAVALLGSAIVYHSRTLEDERDRARESADLARQSEARAREEAERARESEERARESTRRAEEEAERAVRETTKARETAAFLTEMFEQLDPSLAGTGEVTAKDLLAVGARRLEDDESLTSQPGVKRDLLCLLGAAHSSLALYDEAEALFRKCLALIDDDDAEAAKTLVTVETELAQILQTVGRVDEAEEHVQHSLEVARRLGQEDHLLLARALHSLGHLRWSQSRFGESERLMNEAIEQLGDAPEDRRTHATVLNDLALLVQNEGRHDEALELFEQSLALHRQASSRPHVELATTLFNLGQLLRELSRHDESERCLEEALRLDRLLFGDLHPNVAHGLLGLANLRIGRGDVDGARPLEEEALAIRKTVFGPTHSSVAHALRALATLERHAHDYARSEALYLESLAILEQESGPDSMDVVRLLAQLAWLYRDMGRLDEAERIQRRVLAQEAALIGPDSARSAISRLQLARTLMELERFDEAREILTVAIELTRKFRSSDEVLIGTLLMAQAQSTHSLGELERALSLATDAIDTMARALPADNPRLAAPLTARARIFRDLGRWVEARADQERALTIREAGLPDGDLGISNSRVELGRILLEMKERDRAGSLIRRGLEELEAALPDDHRDVLRARAALEEWQRAVRDPESGG